MIKPMRFKTGDIVTVKEDITTSALFVPAGTKVKITYTDKLMRCYDIELDDGKWVTECSDSDFV